jgi:alcohol dehydrogenase (cytochrome c)
VEREIETLALDLIRHAQADEDVNDLENDQRHDGVVDEHRDDADRLIDHLAKWGFQYTPNDPYDFDEISEHPIIDAKINGEDRKLVVHAARNGFFYALDRTNGSFVADKQYVDELNWTSGLDPKTGKPLNYDPNADVQVYVPGSHSSRTRPVGDRLCPSVSGGKNWQPSAYNPQLGLVYIPSIEGCNHIETVVQQDRDDQGGTVKARERFTGGPFKFDTRLHSAL